MARRASAPALPFSAYGVGSLTGALAFGFVVRLVYVKLRRDRIFTRRVCTRADQDGVLREDGAIPPASARALGNEVGVEMRSEGLLP